MSDDDGQGSEEQRWCEGHQTHHPISAFYKVKNKGYAGGYRYRCKELTNKANTAAARAAPEGSQRRETQRRGKRKWAQGHPENARTNSANYRSRKRKAAEEVEQAGEAGQGDQGEARPGHLDEQIDQAEG